MAIFPADNAATNSAIRAALKKATPARNDWDAEIAAEARDLTDAHGWSWDFTTWRDALADFDQLSAQ